MISFDFVSAADIDSASRSAAKPSSRFVAGGTNLIDLMKLGVERPTTVIDITPLARRDPSLAQVSELPNAGLRLGALAHMSDVAWDPRVRDRYPFVSQSLLLAASGQLRNMATMGGNVLQRPRCPYFRDVAMACNKREPGTGCSAMGGINRTEAILGTTDKCIATHPSDFAVALAALDASIIVRDAAGRTRPIRAADFFVVPSTHPERETVIAPGELITAIELPALPFAKRSLFLKVRDRASYAFALASAAVALDIQNGTIRSARVALGGVATKPWRSHEAEAALTGKRVGESTFRAAAAAALAGAKPHNDNKFKVQLAQHTLVRALTQVSA